MLVRAVPIKDFLTAGLTDAGLGSAYSTVPPDAGQALYSALHLTAALVSTAMVLNFTVQSASSSGFAPLTTELEFGISTGAGSSWQRLASPSTDRPWRRAKWALTTGAAGSTAGSVTGLLWVGFR